MTEGKRTTPVVKGHIVLDKNVTSFSGATIYVLLEDVTMQDAPSKLILQQVIKDVSYYDDYDNLNCHQKKIGFELFGDITDFQGMYSIRVHIDVDNDGKISVGDYMSMESYPVITHGYPKNKVSVHVRQVK
jgi:uncharacterized lipoprotein YbaY